jgi:hypothetical protein
MSPLTALSNNTPVVFVIGERSTAGKWEVSFVLGIFQMAEMGMPRRPAFTGTKRRILSFLD